VLLEEVNADGNVLPADRHMDRSGQAGIPVACRLKGIFCNAVVSDDHNGGVNPQISFKNYVMSRLTLCVTLQLHVMKSV
jgi:hypothetical protein